MALKDILVLVDNDENNPARLEVALALAQAHQAHVVGLLVVPRISLPVHVEFPLPASILEAQDNAQKEWVARAERTFRESADKAGISYEWRCGVGNVSDIAALHARYCDIVVVGQRHPDEIGTDMPDHLILSIGRPALVVPYVGSYAKVGERIMVAWDASRLATRAVHDALPLLMTAKYVDVLAINPKGGPQGHGDIPSADICQHLARHGVKAEAEHVYADDIDAGDMLLSQAASRGTDLLVMGAYGHSRWRELILGGLTRSILQHMTMPVMMSH
jgi:nucleotide-binding universal stress UspA family protein